MSFDDDDEDERPAEPRIRVCRLDPAGKLSFPTIDNTLDELQAQVGGYIEQFNLPPHLRAGGYVGLCNEDGQRLELPTNVFSPLLGQVIVGVVLLLRSEPPEYVSLHDVEVALLRTLLDGLAVQR